MDPPIDKQDPADIAKIIKLADGLYVRQAIDNLTWIDMGDYAIAIDALEEAHLAGEVFEAIESTIGDKPVKYLINTHMHYDHVALNAAFVDRYGSQIVNVETCEIPPDGKWFEGDNRRVQLLHTPGCHTQEDCCIWLPDDDVLCVGDIFGWGLIPLIRNLTDETADILTGTYQRLIDFNARVVVGGHGPMLDTPMLARWVEYFKWLGGEVTRLVASEASDEQIFAELGPPDDMAGWWRFVAWKHKDTLTKVIKAVRRGKLTQFA